MISHMIINKFLKQTHFDPSWEPLIRTGLAVMNEDYLQGLLKSPCWLPGIKQIFNAFSLPPHKVNYILVGESPYPRTQSANGYAFWDQSIDQLWSNNGLSKEVNRATSFRNIMKTLLVSEGLLHTDDTSQEKIKQIDKASLIKTNHDFFQKLLGHGFLLLNAVLVLREKKAELKQDAKQWLLFFSQVLIRLLQVRPQAKLLLFGKIALEVNKAFNSSGLKIPENTLIAEHPYNLSFIKNQEVIRFFKALSLLQLEKIK